MSVRPPTLLRAVVVVGLASLLTAFVFLALVLVADRQGTQVDSEEPVRLDGERVFVHARFQTTCSVSTAGEVREIEIGSSGPRTPYGLTGEYVDPGDPAVLVCDGTATVVTSPGAAVAVASRPWVAAAPFVLLFVLLVVAARLYRRPGPAPTTGPSATSPPSPVSSAPSAPGLATVPTEPLPEGEPTAGFAGLALLGDAAIVVRWPALTWTGLRSYELTGSSGARADLESAETGQWISASAILRGRRSHPARAFEVVTSELPEDDPTLPDELRGVPERRVWGRLEKQIGSGSSFAVRAVDVDGTPLGHATAEGGLLEAFPDVVLTGPSGELVGRLTGRANRSLHDPDGRARGSVRWSAPEELAPVATEHVVRIELDPDLPVTTRVLVLAAWLGLESVRTA